MSKFAWVEKKDVFIYSYYIKFIVKKKTAYRHKCLQMKHLSFKFPA